MKKLYAILLISLLAASGIAGDLASSFDQAAARADAQEKERAIRAYADLDLMPFYEKKYSPVFQHCLNSTDHPDTSPLSFVAAIGRDGSVLRLYTNRETNIFACARQTLQREKFPHPPTSPYYMHISMSFPRAK